MNYIIPSVTDFSQDFWSGKRVLVRIDSNIPETSSEQDFIRVDASIPTISYLLSLDARIVLVSHRDNGLSNRPIYEYLSQKLPMLFLDTLPTDNDFVGNYARTGVVTLCENLRYHPGEQSNDPEFVRMLTRGFDYFVQDAFSVCHRPHASIVGVPEKLPSCLGIQAHKELSHLSFDTDSDFSVIIGGSKFDTKLPLIDVFLPSATAIYITGALAHSIYVSRGYSIGASVYDSSVSVAHLARHPKVHVPQYVIVQKPDGTTREVLATDVGSHDVIVDCGPATFGLWESGLLSAQTVIWNGPLGWYEKGFYTGTKTLIGILAQSAHTTIAGGGDTVATLQTLHAMNACSFVSLAGGAMLDYLSDGNLCGLDSIARNTLS
jgi:phosphoglycerate kinase